MRVSFINSCHLYSTIYFIQAHLKETELFRWAGPVSHSSSNVIALDLWCTWDMAFHFVFSYIETVVCSFQTYGTHVPACHYY